MSIELHVPADHPSFAGHFPGRPLVPGVLLLQLAQRAIEAALGAPVQGLTATKFLSPVLPGQSLLLEFRAGEAAVRFDIRSGTRQVAAGTFALQRGGPP
jgi:3-hydroxymyristoyl/3-hydroxydecanoyl-(acyl carrier protein) dehydratase